jgi:glutamate racemase
MDATQPIGIFDSGLGGLSVYREVRALLPHEDVVYYADSAYCPYGTRDPDDIRGRCRAISRLLIDRGAKIIVVACNTATSMAIDHLRARFPEVAFVGLEPAVKPAAALTRSGKVGVLATPRTVTGERLRWLIETHASGVEVRTIPGNGLVELVEAGTLEGDAVIDTLRPMLEPMREAGVDAVVLGCTHYPFLRATIEACMGPDVAVLDSGTAIARRTATFLEFHRMLNPSVLPGALTMLTSAPADGISHVASTLLATPVVAAQVEVSASGPVEEGEALCEVHLLPRGS